MDSRHYLARALGLASESPFKAMLDGAKGIDDVKEYPSLEGVREARKDVGARLSEHISGLSASDLETLLGCLAFLVQHDSYHLGQVTLLRRYVGLDAISYK